MLSDHVTPISALDRPLQPNHPLYPAREGDVLTEKPELLPRVQGVLALTRIALEQIEPMKFADKTRDGGKTGWDVRQFTFQGPQMTQYLLRQWFLGREKHGRDGEEWLTKDERQTQLFVSPQNANRWLIDSKFGENDDAMPFVMQGKNYHPSVADTEKMLQSVENDLTQWTRVAGSGSIAGVTLRSINSITALMQRAGIELRFPKS